MAGARNLIRHEAQLPNPLGLMSSVHGHEHQTYERIGMPRVEGGAALSDVWA